MGHQDKLVTDVIAERVHVVHEFIRKKNYDIYVDPVGYPTIPKQRAMHPLVNPVLYEKNVWKLPTVHDIFAFANLPEALRNSSIQSKIDDIIEYILDERYQRLYRGYGLMLVPPRAYYYMGWSVHLDHYFDKLPAFPSTAFSVPLNLCPTLNLPVNRLGSAKPCSTFRSSKKMVCMSSLPHI